LKSRREQRAESRKQRAESGKQQRADSGGPHDVEEVVQRTDGGEARRGALKLRTYTHERIT
jgi:hypothetical protein